MQCQFHQDKEAVVRCLGCQAPLCRECISELAGKTYCSKCILALAVEAIKHDSPHPAAQDTVFSKPTETPRKPWLGYVTGIGSGILFIGALWLVIGGLMNVFGKREVEAPVVNSTPPEQILANLYPGWSFTPVEASEDGEHLVYQAGPSETDSKLLVISLERQDGRWAIASQKGLPAEDAKEKHSLAPPRGDPVEVVKKDPRYSRGKYYRLVNQTENDATVRVYNPNAFPTSIQVYLAPSEGKWAIYDDNLNMWRPPKKKLK